MDGTTNLERETVRCPGMDGSLVKPAGQSRARPALVVGCLLVLAGFLVLSLPANGHHTTRIDDRIVTPYGVPVLTHIPILAGYEPVPAPLHCGGPTAITAPIYSEDFSGSHSFSFVGTPLAGGAPNLWRDTTYEGRGGSAGHSADGHLYFGNNFGHFSSGHVAGAAQTPPIAIPDLPGTHLQWATKWEVEWLRGYDHLWVEASADDGNTYLLCTSNSVVRGDGSSGGDSHQIGSCSPHQTPCRIGLIDPDWETRSIPVPAALLGKTVQFRFTFDSADGVANRFQGWMIDDVEVGTAA